MTSTALNANSYYPDGKTETFNPTIYQQETVSVTPETVGEAKLKAVCAATAR
jgi:hypothetical protein